MSSAMVQVHSSNKDFCSGTCTTGEQDHHLKLTWNFFTTFHGKGVVDGLGGTVKRAVWRHVRSGQVHTTTAEEYTKIAKERNPKIHVQFIANGDIEQIKPQLDAKLEDVLAVPKTQNVLHHSERERNGYGFGYL